LCASTTRKNLPSQPAFRTCCNHLRQANKATAADTLRVAQSKRRIVKVSSETGAGLGIELKAADARAKSLLRRKTEQDSQAQVRQGSNPTKAEVSRSNSTNGAGQGSVPAFTN